MGGRTLRGRIVASKVTRMTTIMVVSRIVIS